jgi:hypothetical protein
MLLFEFDAALFQFEQREPEFDPLFQLPPRSAALRPRLPLHSPALHPAMDHRTHLAHQHLAGLQLVRCHAPDLHQKTHPVAQLRETRVGCVDLRDLI